MGLSAVSRALILLTTVLDVPGIAHGVRKVTRRPETETIRIGEMTVALIRPSGTGPWPTYVFVNGAHPERRREPVVERLTEGLARAGFLVIVPDPPGLAEGAITPTTLDGVIEAMRTAIERPEVAGGRAAVLGASTGASLALLAAADPELRDRISVVVAVTPFADLEKIVCLVTTGTYEQDGSPGHYAVNELLRDGVIRSMLAAVGEERDRRRLLELPTPLGEASLEAWHDCLPELEADTQAVVRLLLNDDPACFGDLYRELPSDVRATIKRLSPVAAAAQVAGPVELVVPPRDEYFPHGEVVALVQSLPNVHLTVTPTLDHTRPSASLKNFGSFLRFCRFVVRGLATAASRGEPVTPTDAERPA
jgi:pimeloyl-ACP methyl ester carboxylesterase